MSLARLLKQATPGPWVAWDTSDPDERVWRGNLVQHWAYYLDQDDEALAALAREMARLLIDMAALLDSPGEDDDEARRLLARFAELDKQANG